MIKRSKGGSINPSEIERALKTIPGVLASDKTEMAFTFYGVLSDAIDRVLGIDITPHEKACYLLGVFANGTLSALKNFETIAPNVEPAKPNGTIH